MKGTRCKRNLIITIIKTRPQEIHKATFFQATRDLKTNFLSARARWESSSPIVTVWHHFFLLTNGKSRAVQTRRQKLYRSAKLLFSLIVQTSPHSILDLSLMDNEKVRKAFQKKKFSYISTRKKGAVNTANKQVFLPMPRKLELMFNILFTPLLNYTLQKCHSTLKWIFPPISYLSIFS